MGRTWNPNHVEKVEPPQHPHYLPHPQLSEFHHPILLKGPEEFGDTAVSHSKDRTTIHLDVHRFNPDDVHVRAKGNELLTEGHHMEKEGSSGVVIRDFQRRYSLPADANVEEVSCKIDDFGILEIEVPRRGSTAADVNKEFPISRSLKKEESSV